MNFVQHSYIETDLHSKVFNKKKKIHTQKLVSFIFTFTQSTSVKFHIQFHRGEIYVNNKLELGCIPSAAVAARGCIPACTGKERSAQGVCLGGVHLGSVCPGGHLPDTPLL